MMFKLKYKGVFDIPCGDGSCVITLTDMDEQRALSIMTSRATALSIKSHVNKEPSACDDAVDLLAFFMEKHGENEFFRILIDAEKDKGFTAYLDALDSDDRFSIKTDQAVLLSLVSNMDLVATTNAFKYFSTPYNENVRSVALPILGLPDSMLKKALDQAVLEENYESASFIRDEINRREKARKLDN